MPIVIISINICVMVLIENLLVAGISITLLSGLYSQELTTSSFKTPNFLPS